MNLYLGIAVLIAAAATAGSVAATPLTSIVGDDDCFGYSVLASCPDGTLIPSVAPVDNSTAGDPTGTDQFGPLGTLSFDFLIDLAGLTATSATVSIRTVGIDLGSTFFGDGIAGSQFSFNGTALGAFFSDPTAAGQQEAARGVVTLSFDVLGALQDGINTLVLVPEEGLEEFGVFEDYAVDFARLNVDVTPTTTTVPLPASVWLLAAGVGLVGALRRRIR